MAGKESKDSLKVKLKKIPDLKKLSDEDLKEIDLWAEWKSFEEEMEKFQDLDADNLSLSLDELVRLFKDLDKSDFPEKINIPAIKSRLLVLRTFVLKARSISDEKNRIKDLNDLQIKIVDAFNETKEQMSVALREKEYEKVLETIDSINAKIENPEKAQ